MHGYQPAALPRIVAEAERLAQAALPEGLAERIHASGGPTWNRLPVEAVQHLAGAAGPGSPLGELLAALGADTGRRVRERLVTGLAAGKHPNAIARALRDEAGLALSRAETIARTEVLRAYRAASLASYRANPGVVRAFRRVAGKDTRACILCLALDGQEQPTGELLATHPRCRCAVVAVTRAWEELGFPSEVQKLADGAEASRPGQTQERGEAWFRRQGSETQRAMLGPGGFALYQQGARLRDFVAVQDSPDWGPTLRRKRLGEVAAGLRAGDVVGFAQGSGSGGRPGHLISRAEVPAWLADSAVKHTTVHVTSRAAAESLRREGVRIPRDDEDEAAFGHGFYTSNRADYQYGDTVVGVAVRVRRPLMIEDAVLDAHLVDDLRTAHPGLSTDQAIRAAGYDGVVVKYFGGEFWVIVFDEAQVRILEEPGDR